MIDTTKLPYKPGDIIQDSVFLTQGIIIGYFFFRNFNNYKNPYGYTIKLTNDNNIGHTIGSDTYSFTGVKITSKDSTGYWWVLHDDAILIRRSLLILLKL